MANETKSSGPDDGAIATQYIRDQLESTHASLKKTRVIGVISMVIVVAYMSVVTRGLIAYFEPVSAAEIAKNTLGERIEASASDVAAQIKEGIPTFLRQLPEYALREIPAARIALQNHIDVTLNNAIRATAAQVEKHVDSFLNDNKDNIAKVIKDAQSMDIVRQLGPGLEKEMLSYLKERTDNGESLQDKFDAALKDIDAITARIQRLAKGKDLTPDEKRTRRAIAVLLQKTDWAGARVLQLEAK